MEFDISELVDDLGETITVQDISSTFNEWGDASETPTNYSILGIVQVMDGSEDEVKEGLLQKEDLIIFFDSDATNIAYVKMKNKIIWNSKTYMIKNIIKNSGHYEVHANKS